MMGADTRTHRSMPTQLKYAIAIPSARREGTDYLADTVAHLAEQLLPEIEQLASIDLYCPNPPDGIEHPGMAAVRRARAQGDYGDVGERLHLHSVEDLPAHLQHKVASTREPYSLRHCHDYAFSLHFALSSRANRIIFLEDDVRIAKDFLAKTEAVFARAAKRRPVPAFISLFSWDYGPPGSWWPYYGYSQGLAFASRADLEAVIAHLLAYRKAGGADRALSDWDYDGRRGKVAYPSLVQHIGEVSSIWAPRGRPLVAPTFRNNKLGPAGVLTTTVGWLWRAVRRRIGSNIAP